MTDEIDIYRTAHLLISQCEEDAAILAAMNADKFLAKGDLDGHAAWLRVKRAIEELLSKNRPEGQSEH